MSDTESPEVHDDEVVLEEDTTNVLHQTVEEKVDKIEEGNEEKLALHVIDLSYQPPKEFVKNTFEYVRAQLNAMKIGWLFPSLRAVHRDAYRHVPLRRVTFTALGGEVTAILGNTNERHQIISLLGGRTIRGEYDGDIFLSGAGVKPNDYYYDKMAYVQRVSLYPCF